MSTTEPQIDITESIPFYQPIFNRVAGATPLAETENTTNSLSTMTISGSDASTVNKDSQTTSINITADDDITSVTKTDPLDRDVNLVHVWALWGVVIAAGLLVIIIMLILSFRCVTIYRRSRVQVRKHGRRVPKIRSRSPKLPARSTGVMADHRDVRKDFFRSLERGNVQARRQEATQRWLSGNLATSLQYIDGSGSGGQHTHRDRECIPMYETSSRRHIGLHQIPENKELHQEYSFTHSPIDHHRTRRTHPIIHHHENENVNAFVRVIPCNVVHDENANISLSPTSHAVSQHRFPRPRWHTTVRPVTFPRMTQPNTRAVSSEPPRYAASRLITRGRRPPGGGVGVGGGGGGVRPVVNRRVKPKKTTLPKFNLAGEVILTSSEPSLSGAQRCFDFSPKWDDWSYDNTVFELNTPTPKLMVPTNSPQTDDSSSRSQDSLNGVSAGVSHCNVSSDASLTVTVGTSKRASSYEWDFYDPSYLNLPVRFVNGAYVPVIGDKQYWV